MAGPTLARALDRTGTLGGGKLPATMRPCSLAQGGLLGGASPALGLGRVAVLPVFWTGVVFRRPDCPPGTPRPHLEMAGLPACLMRVGPLV